MDKTTILIAGIVILIAIIYPTALHMSEEEKTITVKEKWMKYHQEEGKYLVSDLEGNVYSIQDSVWYFQFDASDRYAMMDANKTYEVKTIGWRIKILSWYSNIIEFEEVKG